MESVSLLDRAGRRRSPATLPSLHQGLPPRNKGLTYPPDPPAAENARDGHAGPAITAQVLRRRSLERPCRSLEARPELATRQLTG